VESGGKRSLGAEGRRAGGREVEGLMSPVPWQRWGQVGGGECG